MKVVEMHPEDLLDKEVLTEAEQARLDAHLERCATCRYERQLRADFADELDGEEKTHFDSQDLIALATGAKKATPTAEPEKEADAPIPEREIALAGVPRKRRPRFWLLAAAAVLLVGGAAAGPAKGRALIRELVLGEPPVSETSPRAVPPTTIKIVHTAAPAPPPPVAPEPAPSSSSSEPSPIPVSTVTPMIAPPAPRETARSTFDEANDARRQGDYAKAIELYRQLQSKYPTSREAHVSLGSVGRLLLDRGDAASALASFDAYQARGHGDLDESVMVGRATALERLGRTEDAKNAWRALLAAYPSTPYAEHARLRIGDEAR